MASLEKQNSVSVGDLLFTYENKIYQPIEEGHWFWIYSGVTLSTGEKVSQVSIQYNFVGSNKRHEPSVAVYFESSDGDVHNVQTADKIHNESVNPANCLQ